jgi:hypothetical protein
MRIILFVILYTTNIMSNLITSFPYTDTIVSTRVPLFPGAYIFRGVPGGNGFIPIYTSIPFFTENGMTEILNDRDAQVLVLPGFALQLYNDYLFGTLNGTIDNSDGTEILYRSSANTSSSCKLFYKFPTGYAEIPTNMINTVTLSVSPSVTTSTVTYNSITYRLYSFTSTASAYTVSITDTAGVGVDCLYLLVGGGGGGDYSSAGGEVAGSGGGGAGTFVYGTIRVTPGSTYTVQIGAGGSSSGYGSSSSITCTGGTPASVIAAGGGSGGGAGSNTNRGVYPTGIGGSTGGTWSPGAQQGGTTIYPTAVATNKHTVTGYGITVEISSAYAGGSSWGNNGGSGGGGAGGVGVSVGNSVSGGGGGAGATWPVTGATRFFAAGGGGNNQRDTYWAGGAGGSSIGGAGGGGGAGSPNTGSGGGGKWYSPAGAGGSGICIIAVPLYKLAA